MLRTRAAALAAPLVVLVLVLLGGLQWATLPRADAHAALLGPGPPATAYPFAGADGPALDPWGFARRSCASYAAWYLDSHGVPFATRTRGPRGTALFGDAGEWGRAAVSAGFPVSATPVPGSIAQWNPFEASPAPPADAPDEVRLTAGRRGHVAVVLRVLADGTPLLAQYDGTTHEFSVERARAPRYLLIGVRSRAAAPPVRGSEPAPARRVGCG